MRLCLMKEKAENRSHIWVKNDVSTLPFASWCHVSSVNLSQLMNTNKPAGRSLSPWRVATLADDFYLFFFLSPTAPPPQRVPRSCRASGQDRGNGVPPRAAKNGGLGKQPLRPAQASPRVGAIPRKEVRWLPHALCLLPCPDVDAFNACFVLPLPVRVVSLKTPKQNTK